MAVSNKSNNILTKDLGYLGIEFQNQLLKVLIEDRQFFTKIESILNQNMFSNEYVRRIVGLMKDRFAKTNEPITYTELNLLCKAKIRDEIAVENMIALIKAVQEMPSMGIDIVQTEAERFFKQQNLVKAVNKANDIIKRGNAEEYDKIEGIFSEALQVNIGQDLGQHPFDNFEKDLADDYRETIPTGTVGLDSALGGGLGRGELGVIVAPMGVGKAQPLTSKVLTPNGFINMGDIKIGDKVIGRDGKSHTVTGVYPQGIRPIYKVSFSNGTSCECDIEHLWAVNTYWQRVRKTYVKGSGKKNMKREYNPDNSFQVMSLKDIINKGLYKRTKGGYQTYVFKVPNNEAVEFERQDVIVDPYILGYYIGDGCYIRHEITVGSADFKDIEANICQNLASDDVRTHFHEERNTWCLTFNNSIRSSLNEIVGNTAKSSDKHIPLNYLYNTKEVRINLLQGLMDSDGTVTEQGHISFTTKSKQLAEDVKFLVKSLGGYANINIKRNTFYYDKNGIKVNCGDAYRVSISFHNEEIKPFRLPRKAERVKYRKKYVNSNYITAIEYVREDEAQCIMVDSDEHLYITDDFIVTHNTSITSGFVASAATAKTPQNDYQGYKVLHVFFEDKPQSIMRKYYGHVTNIDADELSKRKEEVMELCNTQYAEQKEMMRNNIFSVRMSSGEVTATAIRNLIKRYISLGFRPDMVVIDYFECLKLERASGDTNSSEWSMEGVTMRKLEALANELDIAIWIPIQGTKDSIGAEYVGLGQAGGSVKKTQIGHVVVTLAQTPDQKEQGRLNMFICKLRAVRMTRCKFQNVAFNNGTCRFDETTFNEEDDVDFGSEETQSIAAQAVAEIMAANKSKKKKK